MSATPRTDRVCEVYHHSDNCEHLMIEHAQQLERELAVAVQEYRRLLKITLKRKEDADEDFKRRLKEATSTPLANTMRDNLLTAYANHLNATVLRWCPVSEMLPDSQNRVLVICDDGTGPYIERGWYTSVGFEGNRKAWTDWEGEEINVTHWSPWPEVPKGLKGAK